MKNYELQVILAILGNNRKELTSKSEVDLSHLTLVFMCSLREEKHHNFLE